MIIQHRILQQYHIVMHHVNIVQWFYVFYCMIIDYCLLQVFVFIHKSFSGEEIKTVLHYKFELNFM